MKLREEKALAGHGPNRHSGIHIQSEASTPSYSISSSLAKKMKNKALLVCSLLLSMSPLFAVFSAFERITPSSEERDHHPKVKLEKIEESKYLLSVSNIGKHAWLVVCTEERKQNKRKFREVIWKTPGAKSDDVELIVPLMLGEDSASQIQISEEFISRSYIVIDFPNPVFDGGFYYTIDIPEFHRNLNNQS